MPKSTTTTNHRNNRVTNLCVDTCDIAVDNADRRNTTRLMISYEAMYSVMNLTEAQTIAMKTILKTASKVNDGSNNNYGNSLTILLHLTTKMTSTCDIKRVRHG